MVPVVPALVASQPLLPGRRAVPITLEQITLEALQHALQLRIQAAEIRELENQAIAADAQFDWRSFIETSWNDRNEPTASTLDTGTTSRFLRTHDFNYESGLRKKNRAGGEFQIGQRYRLNDSNSQFFLPREQGISTLQFTYEQPLLRDGGRLVQHGMVVVAQLRSDSIREETLQGIQNHLLDVYQTYWALWNARMNLAIRREALARGERMLDVIRKRQDVDGQQEPVLRAASAIAQRRAALVRAEKSVLDQQARLRLLVGGPIFAHISASELLPLDTPQLDEHLPDLEVAFQQAVKDRGDVAAALLNVKSAGIERDIAKHQLLPELNLVLESYVRGLRGDYRIGRAFTSKFREGDPSYSVSLELESPWRNRAAEAEASTTSVGRSTVAR